MPSFYLDIETNTENRPPNAYKDKIELITIQRFDDRNNVTLGNTIFLKAWESSEKDVIKKFLSMSHWLESKPWEFIPIGFNLVYDLIVLQSRCKSLLNRELTNKFLFYDLPKIDIKPFIILANKFSFKGSSLDKIYSILNLNF